MELIFSNVCDGMVADADLSGEGDCCDRERGAAGGGAQVGL